MLMDQMMIKDYVNNGKGFWLLMVKETKDLSHRRILRILQGFTPQRDEHAIMDILFALDAWFSFHQGRCRSCYWDTLLHEHTFHEKTTMQAHVCNGTNSVVGMECGQILFKLRLPPGTTHLWLKHLTVFVCSSCCMLSVILLQRNFVMR